MKNADFNRRDASLGILLILLFSILVIGAKMFETWIFSKPVSAEGSPVISAGQAILVDGETGEVLYEKNADSKGYPASVTKVMTVLVAIETVEELKSDFDQKISVPVSAAGIEGSSIYLAPGEKISIRDLLYGAMLCSGNDAATCLAEIIGGTREHFIEMMNDRATEVGCTGTNFVNPTGLFDENHYTTARDMVLIASEAMKNPLFREVVAAESWQATSREDGRYCYFYNKNKVVHQYEGGNGIKIGYTKASGRTLAASAERDGRELICVVMNAPSWFSDSYALFDYGFGKDR